MMTKNYMLIHISLFLLFRLVPFSFSEEPKFDEETLKNLKDLLKIEFAVNLIQPGEVSTWNEKKVKYTIPEHPVILKLEGTNFKFIGSFTPYIIPGTDKLMLIAASQMWFIDPSKKNMRYFTYIKSISFSFGEKIVFLPLGFTENYEKSDAHNIQIEIIIVPYTYEEPQDSNGDQ